MIKANELRIGNIVTAPVLPKSQDKCYHVITNIGDNYACMINLPDGFSQLMPFEDIEAIPLTEEILLKCGFDRWETEKAINYKLSNLMRFSFVQSGKNKGVIYLNIAGVLNFSDMKHLHQLQNLYFALTGKELKIKL